MTQTQIQNKIMQAIYLEHKCTSFIIVFNSVIGKLTSWDIMFLNCVQSVFIITSEDNNFWSILYLWNNLYLNCVSVCERGFFINPRLVTGFFKLYTLIRYWLIAPNTIWSSRVYIRSPRLVNQKLSLQL